MRSYKLGELVAAYCSWCAGQGYYAQTTRGLQRPTTDAPTRRSSSHAALRCVLCVQLDRTQNAHTPLLLRSRLCADEFAAHEGGVNCLKIGRKSSGVLVTGGDDRKVNVWAIGKPSAILSLSGHQSGVECVSFDASEEVVAAGGQNGTVKLWDLNAAKGAQAGKQSRARGAALDGA